MTEEIELNKRLHELIGLCWHEFAEENNVRKTLYCVKCNIYKLLLDDSIDFTTDWSAFGIALKWIQKHERWGEFLDYCMAQVYHSWDCIPIDIHTILPLPENIVSPRDLSEAIVEFFKEAK